MKTKMKIKLPNGLIIERIPKFYQLGNFYECQIRYKNKKYLVGNGDEYMRGYSPIMELSLPSQERFYSDFGVEFKS